MENVQNQIEDVNLDILSEIGNIGAGNAVTALSVLINDRIDMLVPQVRILSFSELAEMIGGEETLVAGIMLSLQDDIEGSLLFVLESNDAHQLVNRLMGVTGESENIFTQMEQSALMEIGNIITGAYLTAISKLTNLSVTPSVPYLAVDMAGAILSVPAIEFGKIGDKALLIESRFVGMDTEISGYYIMIPTMESYETIMKAIGLR